MLISQDDAYELPRHLEENYTNAAQGPGIEYLGALDRIMHNNLGASSNRLLAAGDVDVDSALSQLQVVRLGLARYLARCSVGGSQMY